MAPPFKRPAVARFVAWRPVKVHSDVVSACKVTEVTVDGAVSRAKYQEPAAPVEVTPPAEDRVVDEFKNDTVPWAKAPVAMAVRHTSVASFFISSY